VPSLAALATTQLVKGLYLGSPGSGKTGSLTSLVKAGYKLRIYDFDNLLGSLIQFARRECPDKLDNVMAQTFTDKMKGTSVPVMMVGGYAKVLPFTDGQPTAFINGLTQLNHWKTDTEDLGSPSTWGQDTFVIIDSLTSMSESAFRYAQALNPGGKETQVYYFTAQQLIKNVISLLTSKDFDTNVLVLAHIDYSQNEQGLQKGFPRTIGSALNSVIGGYFNSIFMAETVGARRQIRTSGAGLIDLKNPVSFTVKEVLPLETGLADFVAAIKA
jgi:hypothetical protein